MATPQSLWDLPALIWKKTCEFLDWKSIRQLHDSGGKPQEGCQFFFLNQSGYFQVMSGGERAGRLCAEDLESVKMVGEFYRRVSFFSDCFLIESRTFQSMVKSFADASRALQSLTVVITEHGPEFLTCRETSQYNWSQFLRACENGRTYTEMLLDVRLHKVKTVGMLLDLLNCSPSDLRCQYLTTLDIIHLYKSIQETLLVRPDAKPQPIAFLLSKFPNLDYLGIASTSLNDSVLNQLAQTNKKLDYILIQYLRTLDNANVFEDVSVSAWCNLMNVCPQLKLGCAVNPDDTKKKFKCKMLKLSEPLSHVGMTDCYCNQEDTAKAFLSKLIKPGMPLTELITMTMDEESAEEILRWCEAFTETLRVVMLKVFSKTGTCSEHCRRVLRDFKARHRQFTDMKIFDKNMFYYIALSKKELDFSEWIFMFQMK